MEQTVDFLIKHKNREFSIADIREWGLMPWARNYRTIGKIIHRDLFGKNVLNARIEKEGKQRRYFIKGKNIIKYLRMYGDIFMINTRSTKRNYAKSKRGNIGTKA